MNILEVANNLVNGNRQEDYGHPLDTHDRVAKMWSVILDADVTAEQVQLCMIALKVCRQCNKPKVDNLVDIAGYAQTTQMTIEKREENYANTKSNC